MTPEEVSTDRLTLEPLRVEHADEMTTVLRDPSIYAFTGGEPPSRAGLRERYRLQIAGPADPGELWMNWIVRNNADGQALGFLQADIADQRAELAWVIAPEHQGFGVASEGANAVRDWLSSQGVRSFFACIHPAHDASQAVAHRVGMSFTGEVDEDGEEIWSTESSE